MATFDSTSGNDNFTGGAGGGAGGDLLRETIWGGQDIFDGAGGNDVVQFQQAWSFFTITYNADTGYYRFAEKANPTVNYVDVINVEGVRFGGVNGTLYSIADVVDDAPVAENDSNAAGSLVEDGAALVVGNVIDNDSDADTLIFPLGSGSSPSPINEPLSVSQIRSDTLGGSFAPVSSGTAATGKFGTLTINPDGSWSYALDNVAAQQISGGATAQDVFTYQLTDSKGLTDTATLILGINGVNDVVVAAAGTTSGAVVEDSATTPAVDSGTATGTINFTDADIADVHSASVTDAPAFAYGTLTLNPVVEDSATTGGSIGWTYTLDEIRADSLKEGMVVTQTYTVSITDNSGSTITQDVTITITGTNDVPLLDTPSAIHYTDTANDDTFAATTGLLQGHDVDLGVTLTYGVDGGSTGGSYSFDSGSYDVAKSSDYGTLYINSSTGAYRLEPNDAAIEAHKTNASVDFTVTVADEYGASATRTLTVSLTGANDTPVVGAIPNGESAEDEVIAISAAEVQGAIAAFVSDRDSPESVTVTWTLDYGDGSPVTVTLDPVNGNSITPPANFSGDVAVTVTATDSSGAFATSSFTQVVRPVSDAPTLSVTATSGDEDSAIDLAAHITAALTDLDGSETLSITIADIPAGATLANTSGDTLTITGGSITLAAAQLTGLTITPPANSRADFTLSVTATAQDGTADAAVTGPLTLSVVVNSVADPDSFVANTGLSATVLTPTGNLLVGSGIPGDAGFAVATDAADAPGVEIGLKAFTRFAGDYAIDPADASGHTYVVNSGTVAQGPAAYNQPGTQDDGWARWSYAVSLGADTDSNGGTLADYTYTFTIEKLGGEGADTATLSFTLAEYLAAIGQSTALNGTVFQDTVNFGYIPQFAATFDPRDTGTFRISVTASDGEGVAAVANFIDVKIVNNAPDASDDAGTTVEDTAITFTAAQLLGNDVDPNLQTLTITAVGGATNGQIVDNHNGTYTFTPAADFNGTATFSYTVSDGQTTALTDSATVSITVTPVNDAPALTGTATTLVGGINEHIIITEAQLLAGWADVDGDALTISGVNTDTGAIVNNGNGTYTLSPKTLATGLITISFSVSDGAETVAASLSYTPAGTIHVYEGAGEPTLHQAVAAADPGDSIFVHNGTHALGTSTLTVNKALTITGESEAGTIIDGAGIDGYGLLVNADGVELSDFTLNGPAAAPLSGNYGIKVQPDSGDPADRLLDFTLDNVTVIGSGSSEVDLNGVVGAVISDVVVDGQATGGVGLAITDSANVTIHNLTTANNAWGSVAIYPTNTHYNQAVNNIEFTGTYTANEPIGIFVEVKPGAQPLGAITFPPSFTNDGDGVWTVTNDSFRGGAENFTFYFADATDAAAFALALQAAPNIVNTDSVVRGPDGVINVFDGMSLQEAIDAASDGDTINVWPGDYLESASYNPGDNSNSGNNPVGLLVNKSVTIQGVDATGAIITDANAVAATITSGVQSNWGTNFFVTASDVKITGLSFIGVSPDGIVNKAFEIVEDNFELAYSVVGSASGDIGATIYINDDIVPANGIFTSDIASFNIHDNILRGDFVLTNGPGVGQPSTAFLLTGNDFVRNPGSTEDWNWGVIITGRDDAVAWRPGSLGGPLRATGNSFAEDYTIDRLLFVRDDDAAKLPDAQFVQDFIANNGITSFAYAVDAGGVPSVVSLSTTEAFVLAKTAGNGSSWANAGDTLIVKTDGTTATETIVTDNLKVDLDLADNLDLDLGGGVISLTLIGSADAGVTGNSQDNIITGNAGDNAIDGGAGIDTAVFHGNRADYAISTGGSWIVTDGNTADGDDGSDTLDNVEIAQFADGNVLFVGEGGFATIQAAVDAASDGDTILVAAGTYAEALAVNKAVTIEGANAGIAGDGTRGAETIIAGVVTVSAAATLDGVRIDNITDNSVGYFALRVQGNVDVTIANSVFWSSQANANSGPADRAIMLDTTATGSVTISGNAFTGAQQSDAQGAGNKFSTANWTTAIWSDGKTAQLTITGNAFDNVRTGLNLDGYDDAKVAISNNNFSDSGTGISIGIPVSNTITNISDNVFTNVDTDFNLQNVASGFTVDLGATNNVGGGSGAAATMLFLGTQGADSITGTDGSDVIFGNGGNDSIDGGDGADSVVYSGAWRDYSYDAGTGELTDGRSGSPQGMDTVANVETFLFSNGTQFVSLADLPNDAPVAVDNSANSGNAITDDGDADSGLGDTLSVTGARAGAESTGDPLTLVSAGDVVIAGTYGDLTIKGDGTYSYATNPSYAAYIALAEGQSESETFTYQVSDYHGASDLGQITVSITGGNDAPVADDVSYAATEGGALLSGAVTASDADLTDTLTFTLSDAVDGLTLNPNGSFNFDPTIAAYDDLREGETRDVIATFTVNDGKGGTDTGTLTITLTGTNDAPVVSGAVMTSVNEGDAPIAINALANASDVDGDTLVVVDPASLPAGVSIVRSSISISFDADGYVTGSIAGQNGWVDGSPASPANAIVDLSGNKVWLVANDPASGDFAGPYSPALEVAAGAPATGADVDQFAYTFRFKAVQGTADGSRIEIDMANSASTDRFNFMAIEYTGGTEGLRLLQNSPNTPADWQSNDFNFGTGNVTLAANLDPNAWHEIRVVATLADGANNDRVDYYVDGVLVGSGSTFENYGSLYTVDKLLFRAGEAGGNPFPQDGTGGNRQGFYIDDLAYESFSSTEHFTFDASDPAFDYLAAGDTLDVTINYKVSDGMTETDASAVITVTGTNDAPVAEDADFTAAPISEDGPAFSGTLGSGALPFSLFGSDVDSTLTTESFSFVGASINGGATLTAAEAGISYDSATGAFTFDPTGITAYQEIPEGESRDVVVTFTVSDGDLTDTGTVTFRVDGANDAPVIVTSAQTTTLWADGALDQVVEAGTNPAVTNGFEPVANLDGLIGSALAADPTSVATVLADVLAALGPDAGPADAIAQVWDFLDDGYVAGNNYYNSLINEAFVYLGIEYAKYLNGGGKPLTDVSAKYAPDVTAPAGPDRLQSMHDNLLGNLGAGALNSRFSSQPEILTAITDAMDAAGISDLLLRPYFDGNQTSTPAATVAFDVANGYLPASSGQLEATDVDLGATLSWSISGPSDYGTMVIDPVTGEWRFTLDNSLAATKALAEGDSVDQVFTATVSDGLGGTAEQTITVTINGSNDLPTSSGSFALLIEPADGAATLTFDGATFGFTDIDTGDTLSAVRIDSLPEAADGVLALDGTPVTAGQVVAIADFSKLTFTATDRAINDDASFTYTVRDSNGAFAANPSIFSLTVSAFNDAPIAAADSTSVTEAGAATLGVDTATGNVLGNDSDADVDDSIAVTGLTFDGSGAGAQADEATLAGTYGTLYLKANGDYRYVLDNAAAATEALDDGEDGTETFTYTVSDLGGKSDSATLTVTVTGSNDGPVANALPSSTFPAIAEGDSFAGTMVAGTPLNPTDIPISLFVTDVDDLIQTDGLTFTGATIGGDAVANLSAAGISYTPGSGSFSIDTNGVPQFEALAVGESVEVVITFTGTDDQGETSGSSIAFTVTGTNDGVVIVPATQAGTATEDADSTADVGDTGTVSGTIDFTDADLTDTHMASFVAAAGNTTALGSFSLGTVTEDGATAEGSVGWTYTLTDAAADSLGHGVTVTETFTVTIEDAVGASATQDVTITITGTNDAPVLTLTPASAALAEDGVTTASGSIGISDVDLGDTHSVSAMATGATWSAGSLSTEQVDALQAGFTVDSDSWDYSVANSALQFLGAGETVTLTFDVTATDNSGATNASTTETVTITITGTNDAPTIDALHNPGPVTTPVTFYQPVDLNPITGTLDVTDIDMTGVVHGVVLGSPTITITGGNATSYEASVARTLLAATPFAFDPAIATEGGQKSLGWTYDPALVNLAFLNGEHVFVAGSLNTITLTYQVKLVDEHGAESAPQTISIVIEGTDELLIGTPDNDTLNGGAFNDDIYGGLGEDTINGNNGYDDLYGGADNDTLNGGSGNDVLYGDGEVEGVTDGDDTLLGGSGDDIVYGGGGADFIDGGSNNDQLFGGSGDDTILGGSGSDTIAGGEGDDFINGGADTDVLLLSGDWADYVITKNGSFYTVEGREGTDGEIDGTDTVTNVENIRFRGLDADASNDLTKGIATVISAAPVLNNKTVTFNENTAGLSVANAATDGNLGKGLGEVLTYSLVDGPTGFDDLFQIDPATGTISLKPGQTLDYEAVPSWALTVTVTDAQGLEDSAIVTINVGDLGETGIGAITDTNAAANAVNENTGAGTFAGITAHAVDPDASDSVSYSLVANPGGLFAIDPTTGVVRVAGAIDREALGASVEITVRATSSDTSFTEKSFTIAINDVNEFTVGAVVDTEGAAGGAVTENAATGTLVGIDANATDADATANAITYSLAFPSTEFAIDPTTGVVTVAGTIDREAGDTRIITIRATSADGSTSDSSFTISVADLDDNPVGSVSDTNGNANSIAETAAAGTSVGVTAFATDADATNNVVTYSLVNDAGGRFAIDATTGAVTRTGVGTLNAGTEPSVTIRVAATSGSSTSEADFQIAVSDVNQAPTATGSTVSVNENSPTFPITLASLGVSDGDPGDQVESITITGLTGLGDLKLAGFAVSVGQTIPVSAVQSNLLTYTPAPDDNGAFSMTFTASDGEASSAPATLTIDLLNVDSQATGTLSVTGTAEEGGSLTAALTDVIDPDGATTTAYQWQAFTGGVWTDLAGETDATLAIAPDQSQVGVSVRVVATTTDTFGGTTVFTGTPQTIANVNDAPTGGVTIDGSATEDQALTANVSALADEDGLGTLAYQWLRGGVEISGANAATYTPGDADVGEAISVRVSYTDGQGTAESVTSAATAPVANVNDDPVAVDDSFSGSQDTILELTEAQLLANDTDVDGDTLVLVSVQDGQHGTVGLVGGEVVFTPDSGYTGPASFTYTVSDGNGGTSTATVNLDLSGTPNEAPVITSGGGSESFALSVNERQTIVSTVHATDDGQPSPVSYAITGGADAAFFEIDSATGALTFLSAPDWDVRLDAGADNVYNVRVSASDGDLSDSQDLAITVLRTVRDVTVTGFTSAADSFVAIFDDNFTIDAKAGSDTITTLGGNDVINGEAGDDTISAGDGADQIDGGDGQDTLSGGLGNDVLFGGIGADRLYGGEGRDRLIGDRGNDLLVGGLDGDAYIFDNAGLTGLDTISDLSNQDVILMTVKLADPDNDNIVTFGGDGRLSLFNTSKLTVFNETGAPVTSLEHDGDVTIGGQHYFVYSLVGSAAGVGDATF